MLAPAHAFTYIRQIRQVHCASAPRYIIHEANFQSRLSKLKEDLIFQQPGNSESNEGRRWKKSFNLFAQQIKWNYAISLIVYNLDSVYKLNHRRTSTYIN